MRARSDFVASVCNPRWGAAVLLAMLLLVAGCNVIGGVAAQFRDAVPDTRVLPAYKGLDGKSVAILVDADEYTLFEHPGVQANIADVIARELRQSLPNTQIMDPAQIAQFQQNNPAWISVPYDDLFRQLQVDRLIFVELVDYQLHQPGNRYIWQGKVTGNVGVAEREAVDPNQLAFLTTVNTHYPPDRPLGVLEADEQTMDLATQITFARAVVNLFREYTRPAED